VQTETITVAPEVLTPTMVNDGCDLLAASASMRPRGASHVTSSSHSACFTAILFTVRKFFVVGVPCIQSQSQCVAVLH